MYSSYTSASESLFNLSRHELKGQHKKKARPAFCCKPFYTVIQDYNKRSSGRKGEPNDEVCLEDGSPSPAVESPTIIAGDDESILESDPRIVVEFAHISQQVVKHGD